MGRSNRMATKFIDRLYFLFTGKLEELDNAKDDWIPTRVADIRRRISDLESRIGRTKGSYQTPKIQQQESTPVQQGRNEELDDIKAKLLGKK